MAAPEPLYVPPEKRQGSVPIRTGGWMGAIGALLVVVQSVSLLIGGSLALFGGRGPIREAVAGVLVLAGLILDLPGRLLLGLGLLLIVFGLGYQAASGRELYRAPSYWSVVTGSIAGILLVFWGIVTILWRFVFSASLVEPLSAVARGEPVDPAFFDTYGSTIRLILKTWAVATVILLAAAVLGAIFFALAEREAICRLTWPWLWPFFAAANVLATYLIVASLMGWTGLSGESTFAAVVVKLTILPLAAIPAYISVLLCMRGLIRVRLATRMPSPQSPPALSSPAEST